MNSYNPLNSNLGINQQQQPYYSQNLLNNQRLTNTNLNQLNGMAQRQIYVHGLEGANAYMMLPNQEIILWDNDNAVFFHKISDSQGRCQTRAYSFKEIDLHNVKQVDVTQFANKSDIDLLNQKIDGLINKLFPQAQNATMEVKEDDKSTIAK